MTLASASPAAGNNPKLLSDALGAIRALRQKLGQVEARAHAPIAIVGMSCRFPGGINSPDAFWSALANGVDAIEEVPPDRWDNELYYDPNPDAPGKICTRFGGFLAGKDEFDARFFRISPREAMFMDPQHRLMLELAWEALEHANIPADRLYRSNTGVFVGISSLDYSGLVAQELSEASIDPGFGTGGAHSAASGRVSYALGLQGPSLSVDTACSSSLVAIQVACQNLRGGECDLALVGGVNLMLAPFNHVVFSRAHMLAPDGRCKTFDDAADGYVRSEGAGLVVLKRLDDAIVDGDQVLAVIRGCAVNQDGPSGGLTVPNGPAQQQVILKALRDAGLDAAQVGYVEAHGTGTALGDPIEINALAEVFATTHDRTRPLLVGSAKTNLGHMEPAAGIAGLMKLVLQLQRGLIAPHLHFKTPSRRIAWDEVPLEVPTRTCAWPRYGERRIGGVSSFGFTGTNAHVIVEEAPPGREPHPIQQRSRHILCLSARTKSALSTLGERYVERLRTAEDRDFATLCHSATAGRSALEYRLAIVSESRTDALAKLEQSLADGSALRTERCREAPKVGFLFTGQGSQYAGMGRELFETQPLFRAKLVHFDQLLAQQAGFSLIDVLYSNKVEPTQIHQTRYAQPLVVSVQLALSALLASWGIRPSVVVGHSVGEFSAACVASVFSEEAALSLVAERGRLMQELREPGGMLAVAAPEADVAAWIAPWKRSVAVAAVNGFNQTVISGGRSDLNEIVMLLQDRGISYQQLDVSHAFHSPLMSPAVVEFGRVADRVSYSPPDVDLVSNVTGRLVLPNEITQPEYWVRHAREPVRFGAGLQAVYELGCRVFLEIGPKPTLIRLGPQTLTDPSIAWLGSLDPRRKDWEQVLESVGALYMRGVAVDWNAVGRGYAERSATLPTYPFESKSYWFDPFPNRARGRHVSRVAHPLLGSPVAVESDAAGKSYVFEAELGTDTTAYLGDHRVFDQVIFPAAGYAELALAAATQAFGSRKWVLENVSIAMPLLFDADSPRRVRTRLEPEPHGTYAFRVTSRLLADPDDEGDVLHCRGIVRCGNGSDAPRADLQHIRDRLEHTVDIPALYADAAFRRGVQYGQQFRGIIGARRGDSEVLGNIALPSDIGASAEPYCVHPVLLDSAFQLVGPVLPDVEGAYLPLSVDRIEYFKAPRAQMTVHLVICPTEQDNARNLLVNLSLLDETGTPTLKVTSLRLRRTSAAALQRVLDGDVSRLFYRFVWAEKNLSESVPRESERRSWLIFADRRGVAARVARTLREEGDACVIVVDEDRDDVIELENGQYALSVARPAHLTALWRTLERTGRMPERPGGILYFPCLDLHSLAEGADPALEATGLLGFGPVLNVAQAVLHHAATPLRLFVITRGAVSTHERHDRLNLEQASIVGLLRTLRDELPLLECRHVDLDPLVARRTEPGETARLTAEFVTAEQQEHVAFRGTQRLVPRLEPWRRPALPQNGGPVEVTLQEYGSPDNLVLTAAQRRAPGAGEVEIAVRAAGVNFKDVLHAWGLLKAFAEENGLPWVDRRKLGFECAGTITRVGAGVEGLAVGDAVIGLGTECMSHYVTLPAAATVPKPANIDYPEAAGLPTAFLTAYYGLVTLAQIRRGDKVLIHAAAGGVGQAAVQLCKRIGAEVFATASPAKWDFLRAQGIEHIWSSRTLDFQAEVLEKTGGRGVDIVLNSLTGDFIPASFAVLARGGRFVEIGKRGVWSSEQVREARPDAQYFTFDLGEIDSDVARLLPSMLRVACEWISEGSFHALPVQIFPVEDVRDAFRQLAQAKNVGKVVVEFSPVPNNVNGAAPAGVLRPDATYLITGGLGALGLETADWLVEKGARNLALLGRREPSEGARARIQRLSERGVRVSVLQADLSDPIEGLREALDPLLNATRARLAGIIHAAGSNDDAQLADQTWDRCLRVLGPKVNGAWNLHCLTKHLPLDFFVAFSSLSGALGSAGQAAYAAGNTFMDALMQHRRSLGLPGLSIGWGPWATVGMAARLDEGVVSRIRARGVRSVPPRRNLSALELLLERSPGHVVVASVDWNRFAKALRHAHLPDYLQGLVTEGALDGSSLEDSTLEIGREPGALKTKVARAPAAERQLILSGYVRSLVARTLRFASADQIDPRQGFFDMGVDSLSAVELKTRLELALSCKLTTTALMDFATPEALTNYIHADVLGYSSAVPSAGASSKTEETGHGTEP